MRCRWVGRAAGAAVPGLAGPDAALGLWAGVPPVGVRQRRRAPRDPAALPRFSQLAGVRLADRRGSPRPRPALVRPVQARPGLPAGRRTLTSRAVFSLFLCKGKSLRLLSVVYPLLFRLCVATTSVSHGMTSSPRSARRAEASTGPCGLQVVSVVRPLASGWLDRLSAEACTALAWRRLLVRPTHASGWCAPTRAAALWARATCLAVYVQPTPSSLAAPYCVPSWSAAARELPAGVACVCARRRPGLAEWRRPHHAGHRQA